MSELPYNDHLSPGYSPPDLYLIEQDKSPERAFFDSGDNATTLNEVAVDPHAVLNILQDKSLTAGQRASQLAHHAFNLYGRIVEATEWIPPAEKLEAEYFDAATALQATKKQNTDTQIILEFLDEGTESYGKMSPVPIAEAIAKNHYYNTEPEIAVLMLKMWLVDNAGIEMPTIYDEMRIASRGLAKARKQRQ